MRPLPYSLTILRRDPHRYAPAILAVAFSAVLVAVQCGLVLGVLQCVSIFIDQSGADIWVMTADADSPPQACAIPIAWQLRLDQQPEIEQTETFLLGPAAWHKPKQGSIENCFIVGFQLDDQSLGRIKAIPPKMRSQLSEPGAILVDRWDLDNLGIPQGVGETAEINRAHVRVVGIVDGFQGHNFAFVFCSLETARMLLPDFTQDSHLTKCVLARCQKPEQIQTVVDRLREDYPEMGVYTSSQLSLRTQYYWLFRSSGGTVLLCTVGLAMLVGFVVTAQTLNAAVMAAMREYAVLDALGIPRWRLVRLVMGQSFWIGAGGMLVAIPMIYALSWAALLIKARVMVPWQLLAVTVGLSMPLALASGLISLRTLRHIEPVSLLR